MAAFIPHVLFSHSHRPFARQVGLSLRVLLCARLTLQRWAGTNLAAPYWRVYCNNRRGTSILSGEREIALTPKRLWIVPPETPFQPKLRQPIEHFFLHFTIGPEHHSKPGRVYQYPLTSALRKAISELDASEAHSSSDALRAGILTEFIATAALQAVPIHHFHSPPAEPRVRAALQMIRHDLGTPLSNADLARHTHMNTNSFSRLFRREMGVPPQAYRTRLRVDRACALLHTSNLSIDTIAERLGFCDRYHFSRVFKAYRGMGPATFRQLNPGYFAK